MNNCINCKYYAEYAGDPKFTPLPICKRYSDLKSAAEAIKNAESCEYNKKLSGIFLPVNKIKEVSKVFQNLCSAMQQLTNEAKIMEYKEALAEVREDLRQLAKAEYYGSTALAVLDEAINKLELLENLQEAYKVDIETSKEIINELKAENETLKLKADAWAAVENLIEVKTVPMKNFFMGNTWLEYHLAVSNKYITPTAALAIQRAKEVLDA